MREILWAAEAKQTDSWARTASLLAMLANVNRDARKTKAFTPDDFMPKRAQPIVQTDITALKMFVKG